MPLSKSIKAHLKYTIIIASLLATSIILYLSISHVLEIGQHNAQTINIAGRQRLLTQRVDTLLLLYSQSKSQSVNAEILETLKTITEHHQKLKDEAKPFPSIKAVYAGSSESVGLDQLMSEFIGRSQDAAQGVIDSQRIQKLVSREISTSKLLNTLDQVVQLYQTNAEDELRSAEKSLIILFALITIFLSGLFILFTISEDRRSKFFSLFSPAKENILKSLLDGISGFGIYMIDKDGIIMTWNKGAQLLKGYDADEVVGSHFRIFDSVDEGFSEKLSEHLEEAYKYGHYECDAVRARKDKQVFQAHVVISKVLGNDGEHLGYSIVTRNIELEIAIKRENEKLFQDLHSSLAAAKILSEKEQSGREFIQKLASNLPGMVGYWSNELICMFANKGYREWFGKSQHETVGMHMKDLLGDDLFYKNLPYIQSALNGIVQNFEREIKKPDGKTGYTWAQYVPDFLDGKVNGFFVLVSDISKLRETESNWTERMETTLATAGIGAWGRDLTTGEIWTSSKLGDLYGLDNLKEALSLEKFLELVVPQDRSRTKEALASIAGKESFSLECQIIRQNDQARRAIFLRGKTFFESGVPTRTFGIVIDVTEQKRAEKQLTQALEYQRAILNSANFSIISTDVNGIIKTFNKGSEQMLKHKADDLIDKESIQIFHTKDELISRAAQLSNEIGIKIEPGLDSLISKATLGVADEYEWTYVKKDGRTTHVRLSITALINEKSEIYGFLAVAQDTEELHQAIETAKLYHDALDRSAIVAFTDSKGVITLVNDEFCEISGYSRHELIGQTHALLNSKRHSREFFTSLWKTIASGNVWRGEICNRRKDGSYYWVSTTIVPNKNSRGKIDRYIAIRFDMTKQKEIENEILDAREQALKAASIKAQFLAHMSHEIRTPLNGLIGMTELMGKTKLDVEQTSYLNTIENCGEVLLGIVNDILDLSKIESGKMTLEEIEYSPRTLVERNIDIISPRAQAKKIKLLSFIDPAIPQKLLGDPLRIGQIIINLLSNAVKFTEDGSVSCRLTSEKKTSFAIRFEVIDSGIGMTEEEGKLLFQSFTQVDSSISRKFGGTGLGLAICKKLVDQMGGEIGFSSKKNEGTTFWFVLPQKVSEESIARNPIHNVQVHVVTNDVNFLKVLGDYCKSWGFEVRDVKFDFPLIVAAIEQSVEDSVFIMDISTDTKHVVDSIREYDFKQKSPRIIFCLDTEISNQSVVFSPENSNQKTLKKPFHQSEIFNAITNTGVISPTNVKINNHPKNNRSINILVVEDNLINQQLISKFLKLLNHRSKIVSNGIEAIAEVKDKRFDIIFMDCQMPLMDGYTATREIRQIEKTSGERNIIIALTANATSDDQKACFDCGMDDIVVKPVRSQSLIEVIDKWVPSST